MNRLLLLTLLVLTIGATHADDRYGKQKVVYHMNVDDAQTQTATLGNVQNHINAVGSENIEVITQTVGLFAKNAQGAGDLALIAAGRRRTARRPSSIARTAF